MTILEKIDYLMTQRSIKNKRQLSEQSGIPYTTIAGLYTKGYDKMKLTTLKQLADFFDVTIDYLGRDEVEQPQYKNDSEEPNLSPDEKQLVNDYRSLNEQGKEHIRACMFSARAAFKSEHIDISSLERKA